jgi:hypothetical protein
VEYNTHQSVKSESLLTEYRHYTLHTTHYTLHTKADGRKLELKYTSHSRYSLRKKGGSTMGHTDGARDGRDLGKIRSDAIGNMCHKLWMRVYQNTPLIVAKAPQNARKTAAHEQHPAPTHSTPITMLLYTSSRPPPEWLSTPASLSTPFTYLARVSFALL